MQAEWVMCKIVIVQMITAMGVTTMDADDCAVLNMLARAEAPAPQNTGSANVEPGVEDYKLAGMCLCD